MKSDTEETDKIEKLCFIILIITIASIPLFVHQNNYIHKKDFYIALHPNQEGISWIRNRLLNHISNPSSPHYGKFLTSNLINRLVRPQENHIKRVTNWLNQYNIAYRVLGDTIHCRSDLSTIDRMLNTDLQSSIFSNQISSHRNYVIPHHLTNIIQFIDGLVFRKEHFVKLNKKQSVSTGFITREVMNRVYNMVGNGLTKFKETSVGAMEYEGQSGFRQSDMVAAQNASDVPPHNVSSDHIVGRDGGPDEESQLDMAVIWWGNGNATLWYEDYNGWMFGWASSFLNRKYYPEVVSISWGWNERDQCSITKCYLETNKVYVQRANNEFMKLAAKGVTILVSSGDAGSPGRTNEGCNNNNSPINPVFPGSSEWVTSVGATYLLSSVKKHEWKTPLCQQVSCANGMKEEVTTYNKTGWTSGAGWSWWTDTPKWQQQEVNDYLNSGIYLPKLKHNGTLRWNPKGRAYPDVSAFGHSCTIHDNSGWTTADGTSCSSPIFAGIIAYLNDHQRSKGKKPLGFANPLLYQMRRNDPSTFQDITVGNSGCTEFGCCGNDFGFLATKGWDAISGLGTPNIGQMIKWLDNHT